MDRTQQLVISEYLPQTASAELHLELATCQLSLQPGESNGRVGGTYDDPLGTLPLHVRKDRSVLHITQHETFAEAVRLEPRLAPLDLTVGKSSPFRLRLEAGLEKSNVDLSGLPLTGLDVKHSQGMLELLFTAPNPQPMEAIDLQISAGRLEVRGLSHANFSKLNVEGGETDCLFDFSGELQRPAQGSITIPQGSLEIHVPPELAARVTLESLAGSIDVANNFTRKAGAFWTPAALAGQSPLLTLKASVLMGTIHLRSNS